MRIIICAKPVNLSEARVDRRGKIIYSSRIHRLNPLDRGAVTMAIQIKNMIGSHHTAISLGDEDAIDALRDALSLGADDGVLIKSESLFNGDSTAVASAIADYVKLNDGEIVLCGEGNGIFAPMLATFLNRIHINGVMNIKNIDKNEIILERDIQKENMLQTLRVGLPAVISVSKKVSRYVYSKPGDIYDAYHLKNIKTIIPEDTKATTLMTLAEYSKREIIVGNINETLRSALRVIRGYVKN